MYCQAWLIITTPTACDVQKPLLSFHLLCKVLSEPSAKIVEAQAVWLNHIFYSRHDISQGEKTGGRQCCGFTCATKLSYLLSMLDNDGKSVRELARAALFLLASGFGQCLSGLTSMTSGFWLSSCSGTVTVTREGHCHLWWNRQFKHKPVLRGSLSLTIKVRPQYVTEEITYSTLFFYRRKVEFITAATAWLGLIWPLAYGG